MSSRESRIEISTSDLQRAVDQQVISADQMTKLWDLLSASSAVDKLSSRMLQFTYYFGALLVIAAMTWFITFAWSHFGGGGLFLIALCYGAFLFSSGYLLWKTKEFKTPGGLLVATAVCMTPLAIFGLEKYLAIKESWLFMEIGTILTGCLALKFVRFPFITAPIAAAFWLLSMDIIPLLFGNLTWEQKSWISTLFGLALLLLSYLIDRKSRKDFAFWGYLFGTLIFWGSLSILTWTSDLSWLLYFFINMALIAGSILLTRNVLMVFGACGVFMFLAHLAYEVFQNSIAFPFALSFIGIFLIGLGILYQKNSSAIKRFLLKWLKKN